MNRIHLGNYEEFFILYMDNELDEDQVKMVDEFLVAHPDLKAEFEILMSTKLPFEEFSFDKDDLLAESMKLSAVDEELLLFIDNELTADKKKTVELELSSNKHYRLEHQVLLRTKLDASERIAYPNKKELYRRTERVISMKVWMRVAAAVIIVAMGGVIYFTNPPSMNSTTEAKSTAGNNAAVGNQAKENTPVNPPAAAPIQDVIKNDVAVSDETGIKDKKEVKTGIKERKASVPVENVTAYTTQPTKEDVISERPTKTIVEAGNPEKLIALNTSKDILNSGSVTSVDPNRTIIKETPDEAGEPDNRKGSLKGFLRKATRVIERRTGIDPTNGDGDLLIGAVSINLK